MLTSIRRSPLAYIMGGFLTVPLNPGRGGVDSKRRAQEANRVLTNISGDKPIQARVLLVAIAVLLNPIGGSDANNIDRLIDRQARHNMLAHILGGSRVGPINPLWGGDDNR